MSTAGAKYADLSGISTSIQPNENPYQALISACEGDPRQVQARYETHRQTRNKQQRAKLLDPDFKGADIDQVLYKLLHPEEHPGYRDPRYCLVFWARPTEAVKGLIGRVQARLNKVLPDLWLMPPDNMHMTAMEIAHSREEHEIEALLKTLEPHLEKITDYTYNHRARLVRPLLGFDASAFALSFVPASKNPEGQTDAAYTYHHLRRDLHSLCEESGVDVGSRYVVPSAHLTVARFVSQTDIAVDSDAKLLPDPVKMKRLVEGIDEINSWLQREYWHDDVDSAADGSEWTVGQAKGLDCSKGTLWYGYSERVRLGKGF